MQCLRNQQKAPTSRRNQLGRAGEYNARVIKASWVRTIKVYQELHRRRANRHQASPFGIVIFIDERFILTLRELRGDKGEFFNDCSFTENATIGRKGYEVLPALVLGYDGGADGLRKIEYSLRGGEGSTFMQRNGNASRSFDRNGRGVDDECNNGEQSGFRKHGERERWEGGRRGGNTLESIDRDCGRRGILDGEERSDENRAFIFACKAE